LYVPHKPHKETDSPDVFGRVNFFGLYLYAVKGRDCDADLFPLVKRRGDVVGDQRDYAQAA
jgi:hypothetical protein